MKRRAPGSFGAQLRALREAAGFTQEELATIAGLSVHAVSALERGERRRPHVDTVRALSAALDLHGPAHDALLSSARTPADEAAADELGTPPLPVPLTPLLGRDVELRTLRDWLADPAARLVTLIGPGGVGKSRLALEIARDVAAASERVAFVPLASIRHPPFVAAAIAEALGLIDVTVAELPRHARVACGDVPTLLVLDNFEHLLDAVTIVADLLRAVAPLRVLTTSRASLRLRGEREFHVGPLSLDADLDETSPADLARSPAIRLFVERAREVQPAFRLTAANGPSVTTICRRLDALPLAIELAARWVQVLTPETLLSQLGDDLLLSTPGARDLPERQRTINATIAWSYQLLSPDEQRAFRHLGVLPGPFSIEAAADVLAANGDGSTEDALRAAAHLIDRSLLLRADASVASARPPARPTYTMMATVRAYAVSELLAAGERDAAIEGLVRYCLAEADRAAEGLVGSAQAEWLNRVRDDLESYRCVLAWLIERGRSAEAGHVAARLTHFWLIRGHGVEGLQWYEQILVSASLSPATEAGVNIGAAMLWYSQGALPRASTALARALARAAEADEQGLVAEAAYLRGHVEHALGNAAAARERFTESLDGFRKLGIAWGTGSALTGLAWVALVTGDTRQAERLLDEATTVLLSTGPWFLSLVRYLRAILAVRRGSADEAIRWVRESLTCIRDLQDKFAFVYSLVPLAAAVVTRGDYGWAARILGARDAVMERTGNRIVDRSVADLIGQVEQQVRTHLTRERWERAYAAGRRSSIDTLLKEMDSVRV